MESWGLATSLRYGIPSPSELLLRCRSPQASMVTKVINSRKPTKIYERQFADGLARKTNIFSYVSFFFSLALSVVSLDFVGFFCVFFSSFFSVGYGFGFVDGCCLGWDRRPHHKGNPAAKKRGVSPAGRPPAGKTPTGSRSR